MKIAIVILNWNGQKLLEQFLPSIVKYSNNATIYVADNASTDNSVHFVTNTYPIIKIIQNISNFGYAKGYNEALKYVEEDIFVLVNSDIEVTENWLNPIIQTFENEPNTAIIQPKILDYKNKSYFEYAGAAGGFIDKFGFPYCKGRIFYTLEQDLGQFDSNSEIFWASGACFFIRKSVFEHLKGFDDSFFAHQEEIDLCWRAFNLGYTSKYCHNSKVFHLGGATLQMGSPFKTYLNFRNSLFMLTKNLPKKNLYFVLFCRLFLDGIAAFQFLCKGKTKHFFAILKAHFSFYKNLKTYYFYHRNFIEKPPYYTVKSIVFQYFIRNKKYFYQL